tara:strand:+ start:669 stop:980 length:312 start_codon:yes stop_codon:yes gene_type:complete
MIVVNSDSTTHTTKVVPRFIPTLDVVYELYNESTRVATEPSNTYVITDGVLVISYAFTFAVDSKYQVKITEGANVVFRGKLIAIDQSTQQYDPTDGLYTYSTI